MSDKLWTPAEKIPENVKKMAWHLFLKSWELFGAEPVDDSRNFHKKCIEVAKAIHENEVGEGSAPPGV